MNPTPKSNLKVMRKTTLSGTGVLCSALTALLLTGCQSTQAPAPSSPLPAQTPVAAAPAAPATPVAAAPTPAPADPTKPQPIVRIKAGVTEPFTDSKGISWLPEQGFVDGETTDRPDLKIENTDDPSLYLTEHYSMTEFNHPVLNGKYLVKLHFCETYEGITGPGQRVFSFNVQGQEFKDLDIWVKAGGPLRPYVESVPVVVTDGKVHITFTPNVENPQINAIEIIPQP